jgi:soluble lytic murein transglycosylase
MMGRIIFLIVALLAILLVISPLTINAQEEEQATQEQEDEAEPEEDIIPIIAEVKNKPKNTELDEYSNIETYQLTPNLEKFERPKILYTKPKVLSILTAKEAEDLKNQAKFKNNLYFDIPDLVFAENANKLMKEKKFKEALLESMKANDESIPKVFLWRIIISSPESVSFKEVSDFIEKNPHFPRLNKIHIVAEGLLSEISESEVIKWFENQGDRKEAVDSKPKTYLGRLKLIDACAKTTEKANNIQCNNEKFLSDIWINHDFNHSLKKEKEFIKANKNDIKQYDTIARINRLIWNNQLTSAQRIFHLVNDDYKNLFKARIALKNNREDADLSLKKVPDWLKNDDGLMYDVAEWMIENGESDEKILEHLKNSPKISEYSNRWWQIKRQFLDKIIKQKNYTLAYELASNTNYSLEDNDSYIASQWLAGWISFRFLQDYKKSYRHFYNIYKSAETNGSKARGAFWAGHSAEKLGNYNVALNWFNEASKYYTSFYGQVAFNILQKPADIIPKSFFYRRSRDFNLKFNFEQKELLKAINLLYLLNEHFFAKIFINQFITQNKGKDELIFISKFNKSLGRPDYMIESLKTMMDTGSFVLSQDVMPRLNIFNEFKDFKIKDADEALVHGIIMVESQFDPKARSPVGALGLMQVVPNTAQFSARELKIPYAKEKLTDDLRFNVSVGSFYINHLIQRYKSLVLAIAAYNAGVGVVDEWLRANPFPEKKDNIYEVIYWIESIPYLETRQYVQKVLTNYQLYKMIIDVDDLERIIVGSNKKNIGINNDLLR